MTMSQAVPTHTRIPFGVTILVEVSNSSGAADNHTGADSSHDVRLGDACRAALVTHGCMTALSTSVADLLPEDPRHAAAYAAIDLLKPRWATEIAKACRTPAAGPRGLLSKASLLEALVVRDEADVVQGGPALQLAASLADDLLVRAGDPSR